MTLKNAGGIGAKTLISVGYAIGRIIDKGNTIGYVVIADDKRWTLNLKEVRYKVANGEIINMDISGEGLKCTLFSDTRLLEYNVNGQLKQNGLYVLAEVDRGKKTKEFKVIDGKGKIDIISEAFLISIHKQGLRLINCKYVNREGTELISVIKGELPKIHMQPPRLSDKASLASKAEEENEILKVENHKKYLKKALKYYLEVFKRKGYIPNKDNKTERKRSKIFIREYVLPKLPKLNNSKIAITPVNYNEIIALAIMDLLTHTSVSIPNKPIRVYRGKEFSEEVVVFAELNLNKAVYRYMRGYNYLVGDWNDSETRISLKTIGDISESSGVLSAIAKNIILIDRSIKPVVNKKEEVIIDLSTLDFSDVNVFREFGYTIVDEEAGSYFESKIYGKRVRLVNYMQLLNGIETYCREVKHKSLLQLVSSLGDLECIRRILAFADKKILLVDNKGENKCNDIDWDVVIHEKFLSCSEMAFEDEPATKEELLHLSQTFGNRYMRILAIFNTDLARLVNSYLSYKATKYVDRNGNGPCYTEVAWVDDFNDVGELDDDSIFYYESGFRFNTRDRILVRGKSWQGLNKIPSNLAEILTEQIELEFFELFEQLHYNVLTSFRYDGELD
ncbi:hypothetical protein D3C81_09820 [compost metagenome]